MSSREDYSLTTTDDGTRAYELVQVSGNQYAYVLQSGFQPAPILIYCGGTSTVIQGDGDSSWTDTGVNTSDSSRGARAQKIDDTVYIHQRDRSFDKHDLSTNTITSLTSPTNRREESASGTHDGKFYVAAGDDGTNLIRPVGEYDPSTDSWDETLADIPTGVGQTNGDHIGSDLYVVCGSVDPGSNDETDYVADVQVYDMENDSWSSAADYPNSVSRPGVKAHDGSLYVCGGFDGSNLKTARRYDPDTDSWTRLADMPEGNSGVWVQPGNDGRLYASVRGSTDVHAYDIDADSWESDVSSHSSSSREDAATANGDVL